MAGCDVVGLIAHDEALRSRRHSIMIAASSHHAEQRCGDTAEKLDTLVVAKTFSLNEILDAIAQVTAP